jgi:hypothetical protein
MAQRLASFDAAEESPPDRSALVAALFALPGDPAVLLARARAEALAIVRANWPACLALARRLEATGRIEHGEVRTILAEHTIHPGASPGLA